MRPPRSALKGAKVSRLFVGPVLCFQSLTGHNNILVSRLFALIAHFQPQPPIPNHVSRLTFGTRFVFSELWATFIVGCPGWLFSRLFLLFLRLGLFILLLG